MQTVRTRRGFVSALGTAALGLGAGCLGDGSDEQGTATGPEAVATAPIPETPGEYDYAVMGDPTDARTVTYFGNWKCPFCARFSIGEGDVLGLGTIVSEYVEPGRIALQYRGIAYTGNGEPFLGPDAPRATRAGLAVWRLDPGAYWAYHERVMANQPPESETWATTERLTGFARDAGVEGADRLGRELRKSEYEQLLMRTTEAAGRAGVSGTPSLLVGEQVVSPFEPDRARQALDAYADG